MKTALITAIALLALSSVGHAQSFNASAAGCTENSFVQMSGTKAQIAIQGGDYTPKCIEIRQGTQVTIDASTRHPLQGIGSGNPIFDEFGGAISPLTVQFNQTGSFGYFCVAHGDKTGKGMAGVIRVVK